MAGVAGRSGTNKGKDKPWREALELAVHEECVVTKKRKLRRIAEAVVDAAIAGDMTAAKEIGDRLDGKPRQETELTGSEGGPILIQEVRRIIVDTQHPDPEGVRPAAEGGEV
jgi:hypothetical protein